MAGKWPGGGGGGKYYKIAKSLISLEPLIVQGRLTPQSLDKNRVSRGSDTNRGPIHLWEFTMINLCCCNGCKEVILMGKFT